MSQGDIDFQQLCNEMQGWYCPRCDTNHPFNMVCMPEYMFWDERINDYLPIGQRLTYCQ